MVYCHGLNIPVGPTVFNLAECAWTLKNDSSSRLLTKVSSTGIKAVLPPGTGTLLVKDIRKGDCAEFCNDIRDPISSAA